MARESLIVSVAGMRAYAAKVTPLRYLELAVPAQSNWTLNGTHFMHQIKEVSCVYVFTLSSQGPLKTHQKAMLHKY